MPTTADQWSRPTARTLRKGLAPQTTNAFPLDWSPEPADILELEANLIEAAALLLRHRNGQLRQFATLAGLTAYRITGHNKDLGAMSADDLEMTVRILREKAERKRALAKLQAEIQAADDRSPT